MYKAFHLLSYAKIFGPIPIANSRTIIPALFAKIKCPSSWKNTILPNIIYKRNGCLHYIPPLFVVTSLSSHFIILPCFERFFLFQHLHVKLFLNLDLKCSHVHPSLVQLTHQLLKSQFFLVKIKQQPLHLLHLTQSSLFHLLVLHQSQVSTHDNVYNPFLQNVIYLFQLNLNVSRVDVAIYLDKTMHIELVLAYPEYLS